MDLMNLVKIYIEVHSKLDFKKTTVDLSMILKKMDLIQSRKEKFS